MITIIGSPFYTTTTEKETKKRHGTYWQHGYIIRLEKGKRKKKGAGDDTLKLLNYPHQLCAQIPMYGSHLSTDMIQEEYYTESDCDFH